MTTVNQISPQQAKEKLNQGAVLVDVREPAEFNNQYIEGAVLHPLGSVNANDLSAYTGDIVIYCQKGVRGTKACEKIIKQNPHAKILNLRGGIEAWKQAGLMVKKGQSNGLPLDRQVQITIGSLVLSFTLLSVLQHEHFLYGAMFMGAGLLFAGITGFCGLARVLALMPWNR